ncbi:MAG: preprotein translocase subunit TatC, partial [Thermoplasmata archaeon]|nr:preprotein translocase subunit TatC [Thermoplasmata archaeon]NIY06728.1 twin-arginine translocase subunit TatC [Thermoplasmata archaeon]
MAQDEKMTLVGHLDELRSRMIYSLIVVFAIALLAYFFRIQILEVLARPLG